MIILELLKQIEIDLYDGNAPDIVLFALCILLLTIYSVLCILNILIYLLVLYILKSNNILIKIEKNKNITQNY